MMNYSVKSGDVRLREIRATSDEAAVAKFVAYEGDDRLTGVVSLDDAITAVEQAKREAGSFAKRRQYSIRASTAMQEHYSRVMGVSAAMTSWAKINP